ncbi:hypothetical protein SAMN05444366_0279 [Flavobacterium saccharophilum]|uniref:Uncharacterized protein n=2 Tax=Flavobacterium saccharophilum TaxID=29534 RepID=A0A1M6ZI23_9FLAO|nr:hypothetical protein SAMN05444366_0279 [Flavobacterium saccharophilum]
MAFFIFDKMENNQKDKLVYISKRPFWHYLIATVFYFVIVLMVLKMYELFYLGDVLNGLKFGLAILVMFVCAAGLTFVKKVYTNSDLKIVKFNFTLFRIQLGKDDVFNDVKYISVYKNYSDRDYEIKIWLSDTKNKKVSVHLDVASAFNLANSIADGLEVDLLDATEKGNFKWVDKDNLK